MNERHETWLNQCIPLPCMSHLFFSNVFPLFSRRPRDGATTSHRRWSWELSSLSWFASFNFSTFYPRMPEVLIFHDISQKETMKAPWGLCLFFQPVSSQVLWGCKPQKNIRKLYTGQNNWFLRRLHGKTNYACRDFWCCKFRRLSNPSVILSIMSILPCEEMQRSGLWLRGAPKFSKPIHTFASACCRCGRRMLSMEKVFRFMLRDICACSNLLAINKTETQCNLDRWFVLIQQKCKKSIYSSREPERLLISLPLNDQVWNPGAFVQPTQSLKESQQKLTQSPNSWTSQVLITSSLKKLIDELINHLSTESEAHFHGRLVGLASAATRGSLWTKWHCRHLSQSLPSWRRANYVQNRQSL